ncbi:uncharacterized protein LOC142320275 [Lycorma delicatula]|uniref:uncharacterized protein LOC142320275 n=1 Tax=Lycorma delicatula TaxID=130591 RepID=UPI003F516862
MEAMSKKEKLARGSAVIKVMRVSPRPGRFLKSFVDPRKMPKAPPKPNAAKGMAAEMPHLDVKNAIFQILPGSAKISVPNPAMMDNTPVDPCKLLDDEIDPNAGIPDGDPMLKYFGYREWIFGMSPTYDGNIADHFNILLGLLITMAEDPENENFPDVEAYPCVQFLKTIKTPNGDIPYNVGCFILYLEYVCQKLLDEG